MVHYTGIVPAFHIKKINWNVNSMPQSILAVKYRPRFAMYQHWRSVYHKLN